MAGFVKGRICMALSAAANPARSPSKQKSKVGADTQQVAEVVFIGGGAQRGNGWVNQTDLTQ